MSNQILLPDEDTFKQTVYHKVKYRIYIYGNLSMKSFILQFRLKNIQGNAGEIGNQFYLQRG